MIVFCFTSSNQLILYEVALGFIRPLHKATLRRMGLNLQTPLRRNMQDERPEEYVKELMRDRRLVETVIGQS